MGGKVDLPIPLIKEAFKPKNAILAFKERVMHRTKKLLSIEFKEVDRDELMKKVQEQYLNLQVFFYT